MHLADVLLLRPVPAAGVFLGLTRRCPLTCRHCSTGSLLDSEEYPEKVFLQFVNSFTEQDRPELVLMSGGEPLLRPGLVEEIARRARSVGTASYLISGMFFARQRQVPPLIARAIRAVDHFAASLDVFHEEQVARTVVLRVLQELVEEGRDVSLQVVGLGSDDPYLKEVTADVRRILHDRVPILVGRVGAVGRAAAWLQRKHPAEHHAATALALLPCTLAAWPLVNFDGTVLACCNQEVVDGEGGPHLRLGHVSRHGWVDIRGRCLLSPLIRAVRLAGPQYTAAQYSSSGPGCDGYCGTCYRLSEDAGTAQRVELAMAQPEMQLIEEQVLSLQRAGGPVAFARRYGVAEYAELVMLGYPVQVVSDAAATARRH